MKTATCLKILVGALFVGFLLLQLIPYGRNHSNPAVVKEPTWDSPATRALAKRACFDCHSNETVWPWYTNVAPVSWLTQHDVDEGRGKLNFSDIAGQRGERGGEGKRGERGEDELGEVIAEGSMPPWFYIMMHPAAKLSDQEKQQLINGLQNSLR